MAVVGRMDWMAQSWNRWSGTDNEFVRPSHKGQAKPVKPRRTAPRGSSISLLPEIRRIETWTDSLGLLISRYLRTSSSSPYENLFSRTRCVLPHQLGH